MIEKRESAQIKRALNIKCAAKGIPSSGIFELTPRCNLNCRMCYVRMTPDEMKPIGREYTAEEWLNLAEEAKDQGLLFLLITGGEPMLRIDFAEIYEGLAKKGLSISINSNGTMFSDDIKALFLRYPPAQVNITLYGVSAEDYEDFCGNGQAFFAMMDAVQWLKTNKILLHLNATMTPDNVHRWEAFEAFAKENDLELRMTAYCFPPARKANCTDFRRLDPEIAGELTVKDLLYREGVEIVREKAKNLKRPVNSCYMEQGEAMQCFAGRSQFWINWKGDMVPCGMLDQPASKPFENGFLQAWMDMKAKTEKIRLCPDCTGCPDKMSCMNCAAVTYTETGRFDGKPEYVCQMNKGYRDALKWYASEVYEMGDETE